MSIRQIAILAALILLSAIASSAPGHAAGSDIVAHIDGKPIARAELAVEATMGDRAENEGMALFRIVLGTLLQKYAAEHPETTPSDAEIDAYQRHLDAFMQAERKRWKSEAARLGGLLKDKTLDAKSRASAEEELRLYESLNRYEDERAAGEGHGSRSSTHVINSQFLSYWKTNRALYRQYGGRVIFQQAGPEPIDAYRKLIEEHEAKGTLRIVDKALAPGFWKYIKTDSMHAFLSDEAETRRMMLSDWWLGEEK